MTNRTSKRDMILYKSKYKKVGVLPIRIVYSLTFRALALRQRETGVTKRREIRHRVATVKDPKVKDPKIEINVVCCVGRVEIEIEI